MTDITLFDPTIPQEEVDRLFRKLKDSRIPQNPIVPDAGDDYGAPLDWVHKLYSTWMNDYNWSTAQREISSWHHYKTDIEGINVHFIHERAQSSSKKRIPLLLAHGWPGSFYEFSRVIAPLTNPTSSDTPAFDLVVPSLPGYAFSSGPPRRGWTLQDTARVFDTLMKRLGYEAYCAQGGDWAHWIIRELGSGRYPACKAVHTNMCPAEPAEGEENERDKVARERAEWFIGQPGFERHMGYAIEMRTRPQTLGVALSDNPVGIMMWVGEKYEEIVDPKYKSLEDKEFVDRLLTTVSLYFFTSPSIMTSMLCYYENVRHEDYAEFNIKRENYIEVPFGCSSFRWDVSPTTAHAVARTGNLKWHKERDYGGHFAALESPDELVEDLRNFYGEWYKT